MKSGLQDLLVGSVVVATLFLYGCGGGTSGDNGVEMPSQGTFDGVASKGDYAKFSILGTTLTYNLSGAHFGGESGKLELNNLFGGFWHSSSPEAYIFTAGNLGVAMVPNLKNGQDAFVVGLQTVGTPDPNKFADKTYVYTEILNDGSDPTGFSLRINKDKTFSIDEDKQKGCWKVIDNHIAGKISAGTCDPETITDSNADVKAVIKPGNSRNGLVVDYTDGSGFGLGLEQKELKASEISGTYYSYWVDSDGDDGFAKAVIDGTNYTWIDCDNNGNCSTVDARGTLQLNKTCDGVSMKGVACGVDTAGENTGSKHNIYVDPEEGYYMEVEENGHSVSIGSNK